VKPEAILEEAPQAAGGAWVFEGSAASPEDESPRNCSFFYFCFEV